MTRAEKAAFWRRHVESLQQSRLSIRAYAERAGVAVSGLKYWRKYMSQARRGNAPLMSGADAFLPVTVSPVPFPEPARVEIVLVSGRRLRLAEPVETPWLSSLTGFWRHHAPEPRRPHLACCSPFRHAC